MPTGLCLLGTPASVLRVLGALRKRWAWPDLLRIESLVPGGTFTFPCPHPSESRLPSTHSGSWEVSICPVGSRICLALTVG